MADLAAEIEQKILNHRLPLMDGALPDGEFVVPN
jgi:hypothetical protein